MRQEFLMNIEVTPLMNNYCIFAHKNIEFNLLNSGEYAYIVSMWNLILKILKKFKLCIDKQLFIVYNNQAD